MSLSLRAEWENNNTVLDIGLNAFGCQVVGWDLCAFWVSTVDLEGYKTVTSEPSDEVKYIYNEPPCSFVITTQIWIKTTKPNGFLLSNPYFVIIPDCKT